MIWPAMLFNLCIGLLFAAYLLRAVCRYEHRVDAIMAKLDQDEELSIRKWEAARDEIRASMRAQTDQVIARMQTTIEKFRAMENAETLQDIDTEAATR
jgi:hypothetical protein